MFQSPTLEKKSQNTHSMVVKTLVSPSIASLTRLLLHPLDTVATFQQKKNLQLTPAVKHIYRNFGLRGYLNGLSLPLILSMAPSTIIFFGTYEGMKEKLNQMGYKNQAKNQLISSVTTAFVATILTAPFESKRIRDTFHLKINPSQTLYYHYRGSLPMLFKLLLHMPISRAGTDIMVDKLDKLGSTSQNPLVKKISSKKNPYSIFMSGFVMGSLAQVVTNPVEVVKTKVMTDYSLKPTPILKYVSMVYQEKSVSTSLSIRLIKFGLYTGMIFGCMNLVNKKMLSETRDQLHDAKLDHTPRSMRL